MDFEKRGVILQYKGPGIIYRVLGEEGESQKVLPLRQYPLATLIQETLSIQDPVFPLISIFD